MNKIVRKLAVLALFVGALHAQSLTIYTEISPPDQFLGTDGKLTGFTVELVQEIKKRLNNNDPIEVVPWVRSYNEVESKPNVVLFAMARTVERNALFSWVGPINEDVYWFFVKAESKKAVKNLDDARKLSLIGVYMEDVRDQYLTRAGFTNLDRSVDETIMVKKLMAGRIDALASTIEGFGEIAKTAGFRPEDFRKTVAFLKVQTYIAVSKGTPEATVKSWNATLEGMKKDGFYAQVYKKYYPNMPLPGPAIVPK